MVRRAVGPHPNSSLANDAAAAKAAAIIKQRDIRASKQKGLNAKGGVTKPNRGGGGGKHGGGGGKDAGGASAKKGRWMTERTDAQRHDLTRQQRCWKCLEPKGTAQHPAKAAEKCTNAFKPTPEN